MNALTRTRTRTRPGRRHRNRHNGWGYLFLAPWLLGFFLLVLGPMAASFALSFTDFNLFDPPHWIGLDNYSHAFFDDERFWNSLSVTFKYVFASVPARLAFALAVAMLLNRGVAGLRVYRAIYYLPSLLGGSVAIAVLWRQLFGSDGLLNHVLSWFGADTGHSWIADPDTSLLTMIVLAAWQFGSPMIIFLAGLRQIPSELYEAAELDGAGPFTRFRSVTLPLLSPLIFFNLLLQVIGAFQAFTPAYVVSNGTGGPSDSTLFYTLYLYEEGFTQFHMGYASALAWVLFAVIAVFSAIAFLTSRYWVHYADVRS
ncbi:carbohydrate ABC transporter permease [Streptomyces johnsoniae]|uniref:Sugar ABC transporter permease n=1 Tax=Streptomyces johnsoniae TaxID=3075532 RepID=A0ABU2S248_9ACTN|nr:sugar ABC transporter permease [Streptomyces sp. DSM 41886]MDT0443057.1 sugar ABC transporter permease [Streptomyces sp. DSM 41886]